MSISKINIGIILLFVGFINSCAEPKIDIYSGVKVFQNNISSTVIVRKFYNDVMYGYGCATCIGIKKELGPNNQGQYTYLFVTAAHIVKEPIKSIMEDTGEAKPVKSFSFERMLFDESGRIEKGIEVTELKDINFVDYIISDHQDIAIVILKTPHDLFLSQAELADFKDIASMKPGSKCWAIGAPVTQILTIREAHISGYFPNENGEAHIFLDSAISPGCSGGGLYTDSGLLFGVVVVTFYGTMGEAVDIREIFNIFNRSTNVKL